MTKKSTKTVSDQSTLLALQELLGMAEKSLHHARILMSQLVDKKPQHIDADLSGLYTYKDGTSKVIEGIFTGKDMLGVDKKSYPVPANYASKSKIVEGSKLKVTITSDGKYQYKIINEVSYDLAAGTLIKDGENYMVISQRGIYQVLPASITYLQAKVGDRVSLRIPHGVEATYATIDSLLPAGLGLVEA